MLLEILPLLIALSAARADNEVPVLSINQTNVPDVQYELTAVSTLTASYVLFPTDVAKRLAAFSQLFGEKYPIEGGWYVANECAVVYFSDEPLYVKLNVEEEDGVNRILIFGGSVRTRTTPFSPTTEASSLVV